jgi:hypothetical protein
VQEGAAVATTLLTKELDASVARVDAPLRECRRFTMLNVIASALTLLVATAVLCATLPRF